MCVYVSVCELGGVAVAFRRWWRRVCGVCVGGGGRGGVVGGGGGGGVWVFAVGVCGWV